MNAIIWELERRWLAWGMVFLDGVATASVGGTSGSDAATPALALCAALVKHLEAEA
jgi:hypothetical protein